MEEKEQLIGIGKIGIGVQNSLLKCIGLGSCVCLTLMDKTKKVGGMAHVMLPKLEDVNFSEVKQKVVLCEHDSFTSKRVFDILSKNNFDIIESNNTEDVLRRADPNAELFLVSKFFPQKGEHIRDILKLNFPFSKIVLLSPKTSIEELDNLFHEYDGVIIEPFNEQEVLSSVFIALEARKLRFANIAVPNLINELKNKGSRIEDLEAKLVGGANLFSNLQNYDIGHIGERNVEEIKNQLNLFNIRVAGEEVGKSIGRTAKLNISTGELMVKTKDQNFFI